MSATTTPNDSPVATPIQPLHNPSQAAQVVVPQAPLGNVVNQAPGMGAKALLAKKMAKSHNPSFISPTDNLMTPCTQKLTAAKKKHFSTKSAKPMQLFPAKEETSSDAEEDIELSTEGKEKSAMDIDHDDENPF